jgi:hypothetical protein
MGIAVAAFFVVAMVITLVLGLLVRSLLKKTGSVIDVNVRPRCSTRRRRPQTTCAGQRRSYPMRR